ncbi:hypothetical protein [Williamsia serinedens]|uniref:Uncharacterized protein n=1 Tax=Williamsia serinedens TaxID=391736 RepID=A0ABT1GWJ6_9NOCA|nr:hypothetical protein [Williamsia serinedens]MCP2159364.1 hypothetical protein [Williamsia serinedens]
MLNPGGSAGDAEKSSGLYIACDGWHRMPRALVIIWYDSSGVFAERWNGSITRVTPTIGMPCESVVL